MNTKLYKTLKYTLIGLFLIPLVFLFIKPKADSKSDYLQKIQDLEKRTDLISRFIGTSFMTKDQSYNINTFNPNIDLGEVPYDQMIETPWYNVFYETKLRSIKSKNVTETQAENQLKELNLFEAKFARKLTTTNLDDGHYFIPFELYEAKAIQNGGGYTLYEATNNKLTDKENLLSGVLKEIDLGNGSTSKVNVISKIIGNKAIFNFIANTSEVKDIKGLVINPISGLQTPFTVFPASNGYAASFDVTIPLGLNPSDFIFAVKYIDKNNEEQITPMMACKINYDKAQRSTDTHEVDKKSLIEGITYEDYIRTRLTNLIVRAELLTNNSAYQLSSEETSQLNTALNKFKDELANFNYDTTNIKNFIKDAATIYELEYKNTLKKKIVVIAKIILGDFGNKVKDLINPIEFSESSVNSFKTYLEQIETNLVGRSIYELMDDLISIGHAKHNYKLKVAYQKMSELLAKGDTYKRDLNWNFYDDAGKEFTNYHNEIKLLVEDIKQDYFTKEPIKIREIAQKYVDLIAKVKHYFNPSESIILDNPYDEKIKPANPSQNQDFTMEYDYEHDDPSKATTYDYASTLYKAVTYNGNIIQKAKFVKKDNKYQVHFEFAPVYDSNAKTIFAINKIEKTNNGGFQELVVDEKQTVTMTFNDGVTQTFEVPKKGHFDIDNPEDKVFYSINYYHANKNSNTDHLGKPKYNGYDDGKFVFKQDTKQILGQSLNITQAAQVLAELNQLSLVGIPESITNQINAVKPLVENMVNDPTNTAYTQEMLQTEVDKLIDLIDQVNKYNKLKNTINEYENFFNEEKAKNIYSEESINEYQEVINKAKELLANNTQAEFRAITEKLINIRFILKLKNISYEIAKEALKNHREEYLNLPLVIANIYQEHYEALKNVVDNQSASSNEHLRQLIERFNEACSQAKRYYELNQLYLAKKQVHEEKVASNLYEESSIANAQSILNRVKDALDANKQNEFINLSNELNNIEYVLKSTTGLENGEYTVNVSFRQKSNPSLVSHANTSLVQRARVVVSGNKITIYLRLKQSNMVNNQASGVITKITYENGQAFTEEQMTSSTIKYEGIDYTYNHPSLVSGEVTYGTTQYIVNITVKSPVFKDNDHEAEGILNIDWGNITKGYNSNELDKTRLNEYKNDLVKELTKGENYLSDQVKANVKQVIDKLVTAINDINLHPDKELELVNEADLVLYKLELFSNLYIREQTTVVEINNALNNKEFKQETVIKAQEEFLNKVSLIKKAINELASADQNQINKIKADTDKLNLVTNNMLYNTEKLKALLTEINKLAKPDDLAKNKAQLDEIKTYIETNEHTRAGKLPSLYEEVLNQILKSIKPNVDPEPAPSNNEDEKALRYFFFNIAKLQYQKKSLSQQSETFSKFSQIINNLNEKKVDRNLIDEFLKTVDVNTEAQKEITSKDAKIYKENTKTESMIGKNFNNKVEFIKEGKSIKIRIKFNKGSISKLTYNDKEAVHETTSDHDIYTFEVEAIKELYKVSLKIKAMGTTKTVDLVIM